MAAACPLFTLPYGSCITFNMIPKSILEAIDIYVNKNPHRTENSLAILMLECKNPYVLDCHCWAIILIVDKNSDVLIKKLYENVGIICDKKPSVHRIKELVKSQGFEEY